MPQIPLQITQIIREFTGTSKEIVDKLTSLLYKELRLIAKKNLQKENRNQTIRTTALVNEAYLKLAEQERTTWKNRSHFLGVASIIMRRIIIDYAQKRVAQKRGGDLVFVTLNEELSPSDTHLDQLIALDMALDNLKRQDPRQCLVVECVLFGGMPHEEIAELLQVSIPTVHRDWRLARAWLSLNLKEKNPLKAL